jgi:tRNA(fMet)-specific endonuclease VapC
LSFVLDTTVLSALMRADGLARLPRSRRRRELEERLATLLAAIQRAHWTDDVSLRFGDAKADLERRGERVDDFDVAIAAHALAASATVVTATCGTSRASGGSRSRTGGDARLGRRHGLGPPLDLCASLRPGTCPATTSRPQGPVHGFSVVRHRGPAVSPVPASEHVQMTPTPEDSQRKHWPPSA